MNVNTFGVLGDLCKEAEWIWQRMQSASRSIQRCQHPRLKERLTAEICLHRNRCLAIQDSLAKIKHYLDPQSAQKHLLEELLFRCLSHSLSANQIY